MSDDSEMWREVHADSQSKRADNQRRSTALLSARGIPFESFNEGLHLVVDHRIDFWPSTGKWIFRPPIKKQGRGVFKLLDALKLHTARSRKSSHV